MFMNILKVVDKKEINLELIYLKWENINILVTGFVNY